MMIPKSTCRMTRATISTSLIGHARCSAPQGQVTTYMIRHAITGTVSFSYLPRALECLIKGNSFDDVKGTLETASLPGVLIMFAFPLASLSGTVDFTTLPSTLTYFGINANQFSGGCDLTKLPSGLEELRISKNKLSGEISLSSLPDRLDTCLLDSNSLSGPLDLEHLPDSLKILHIGWNGFTGKFSLRNQPSALDVLDAKWTRFDATAVVGADIKANVSLQYSGVSQVVDENGIAHRRSFSYTRG